MLKLKNRIEAFAQLGEILGKYLSKQADNQNQLNHFEEIIHQSVLKSKAHNSWFGISSINRALAAWSKVLTEDKLNEWLLRYEIKEHPVKNVAIIMAGNIPLVGFHDFLSVLISGHSVQVKLSSDDRFLVPALANLLVKINPEFAERITFAERIERPDAVIATGSNNSARYFDYYFAKYPHIIRKNRTSVAVITGVESDADLKRLGDDIFTYFGLGCRNVSKLYIPEDFDLDRIFGAILSFSAVVDHNKYGNNYDYNRAIYMMNKIPFIENGFIIFREETSLHTPVSVIHYERYNDLKNLQLQLKEKSNDLQCLVGNLPGCVPFGKSQEPELWDYADDVDTIKFLTSI